ncbi:MAG: threonine/serine exporter family protein [Clostridium sp.]
MIKQIILAFLGSVFPAILFNIDRKKLIWAGVSGTLAWITYLIIFNYAGSVTISTFMGAFVVGVYSEVMARKLKAPSMQFSIPGIFPLVPGVMAYNTVIYIVDQNYDLAYTNAMKTIIVGGAIAFGMMLSSTTYKFFSKIQRDIETKKAEQNKGKEMD